LPERTGNGLIIGLLLLRWLLLRTLALNLLHCNGFRSIRAGLMAVAHDIGRMQCWVGTQHCRN
jgi:hypothetical protein